MRKLAITSIFFLMVAATHSRFAPTTFAETRDWTDASGKFNVEAELLTADENLVVLEREDGELMALKREQLSKADREYLREYDSIELTPAELDVDSKWKLNDGEIIAGRLMGFGRQELNVKRERGDLWVNDLQLSKLPSAYRKVLPSVVSAIDKVQIESPDELEKHLADIGGGPYKYTVAGIQLDLKKWGVITIPLALLASEETQEVAPGFARWLASQKDDVSKEDQDQTESYERLALDSRDRQRRRSRKSPQHPISRRQMQMMELGLLAAEADVIDIWQVQIQPRNRYGYSRTVIVSAQNSLLARQKVAQRFRGWTIGAIAKRSY